MSWVYPENRHREWHLSDDESAYTDDSGRRRARGDNEWVEIPATPVARCPNYGIGNHDCSEHGDVWPPAPAAMTVERAIEVIALHVLARAVSLSGADDWGDYPEIGESDWDAIRGVLNKMIPPSLLVDFDAAYALLKARADGVEA